METSLFTLVRLALALSFGLCGFLREARAFQDVSVDHIIDNRSGITLECGLAMPEIPASGFWPVHFRIRNNTSQGHSWEVRFNAGGGGSMGQQTMSYTKHLSVGAGQTREWDLLVPRPSLDTRERAYGMVRGSVRGYGIKGTGDFYIPTHYSGGYRSSAFVLMSDSLASNTWSKLMAELKTASVPTPPADLAHLTSLRFSGASRGSGIGGRELTGAQISLKEMPADWRAFSGASALWLSRIDWENLSSDRRRAIRQWVTAGGHLFIASADDKLNGLAMLPQSLDAGKQKTLGLGWIKAVKYDTGELPVADTAQEVLSLDSAPLPAWKEEYEQSWALSDYVGWPRLNVPLVIGFVALFAVVIGPLNLRWFAPPKRRSRLFLTIPVLSVAASVMLFAAIGIGDGIGGFGGRNALLYMPAAENQVTLLQEQVARSRLLFGRTFKVPETVQVSFVAQKRESDKGLSFAREGDVLSGDWFRSRMVQTQILRANIPSRAEVILQPGGAADTAPVLLSSAATPLNDVYYVDVAGRYWHAERLDTGRPVKLESSDRKALDEWVNRIGENVSPGFRTLIAQVAHRPGHFYALAGAMPQAPLDTLPSLKWNKQSVICFGTCTGAESK